MVFIVKVAYNIKMVKIAKLSRTHGGKPNSGLERGFQLALHSPHKKYSRFLL